MTTSQNIKLNVGNQGLSFAIDKKLDEELKAYVSDVHLDSTTWASIFNLIKNNQVASNKSQFGEQDTNINDGMHFVVPKNENYG